MESLIVLNGQYYCGVNAVNNKLIFKPSRSEAVALSEDMKNSILHAIFGWVMDNEIKLKRLEVLRA